jgi:hypothetical protein
MRYAECLGAEYKSKIDQENYNSADLKNGQQLE